jgi:hypothetical protein
MDPAMVGRLQVLVADRGEPDLSEADARGLLLEAVEQLGGDMRPRYFTSRALGQGRWAPSQRHVGDHIWIPEAALRAV